MMLGESHRPNTTVDVPPWSTFDDPTVDLYSLGLSSGVSVNYNGNDNNHFQLQEAMTGLQRYLPSNDPDLDSDSEISGLDVDSPVDAYSCDQFRMFEFKVRRCARGRSHDWTECPYAHPGEKARRRDPRKYHYSGTACPEFRKGSCRKGDACEFAHGVFECWLHPARYRTQPCKDGTNCRRRVCFFAHTPEQLRVLSQQSPRSVITVDSYDGSPLRQTIEAACSRTLPFTSSPLSISPPSTPPTDSPPMSPMAHSLSFSPGSHSIKEMVASLRNLQIAKVKSLPSSYKVQVGGSGFGSPRGSMLRPGFFSLPTTPSGAQTRTGIRYRELWDKACEEEPAMERVESGKTLRAKMFEKLSKENSLERVDPDSSSGGGAPDVGWVSELVNLN
ncbi:zinc finger CCCH domain-containing protein 20 [Tripterygium wilfordii]|uniref:Zinc finger CCCH domain-containing protein 20 n=1 Tax=Tripterygium wilfordii TaxID=458696 RepID=A0A7J7DQ86_TRIWF|nr:zinc finger CCCH domain-containing protein 20-like [Tripterygium wilfordii]KAF5748518.1 zinc finger CCCH domain-containing protein 20 [Tripterygium wilfordii]